MHYTENTQTVIGYHRAMKQSKIRRIVKKYTSLHEVFDAIMQKASESYDITCHKGCSACCKQSVTIDIFEAISVIAPVLFSQTQRLWFYKVVYDKAIVLAKACVEDRLNARAWFEKQIPCIFLSNEECTVYEHRPTICRIHSVTSPAIDCSPPSDKNIMKLNIKDWFEATVMVQKSLAREVLITEQMAPLPVAIVWAVKAIENGEKALRTALSKHPVFSDDNTANLFWAKRFASVKTWEYMLDMADTEEKKLRILSIIEEINDIQGIE